MLEIVGKTALVTVAGRTMGCEISLYLARRGANIVVNYNTSSKGAEEVCASVLKRILFSNVTR